MFIAGSYMVYAAPTVDKNHGFRMADILAREMTPRKAACVVVQTETQNPTPVAAAVASKDLKFGMERILSDAISSHKVTDNDNLLQIPSSPCPSSCVSGCSTCFSRCCPLPACRCGVSHLVEPFPIYSTHQTYSSFAGQPLVSYPSSLYTSASEMDPRLTASSLHHHTGSGKRKRTWSRAVFSNLQRKGLEKRFQIQKYITKPDRRQLASTLGLTDAQVKVWFQNRRMKWRHSKEAREQFKAEKKHEETQSRPDETRPVNDSSSNK